MQIGAQMYTVREFTKTPENLAETLKKIADIGYKTVQVSGTCEYDGDWLNAELKKNGLKCVLTHYSVDKMAQQPEETAILHKKFNCPRIGIGFYDFSKNSLDEFSEKYMPVAESFLKNGCKLYYHNHYHELRREGKTTLLEAIMERFPQDILGITLDTYWIQKAGGDPAQWIERLAGRVDCVHYKDMKFNSDMAVIGEGNMNFDRITAACESSGTKYVLVEQDDCYGEDPFACLKRSYDYLRSTGIE